MITQLGDNMRFKHFDKPEVTKIDDMVVIPIPQLPEGMSPQMSGFWNAMQKRKHFRLRQKN